VLNRFVATAPSVAVGVVYDAVMIDRFRLYQQNVGTTNAVIWLAVLGYLVWNAFQFTSPLTTWIVLIALVLCLIAPLATMPICERYPVQASRIARWFQYGILVVIALSFFNVYQLPGLWFLVFLLGMFFYFGWTFWFHSSPAVYTQRRANRLEGMYMANEEAALQREIEKNQRELDGMGGDTAGRDG
jgi:hypothetical protein